MNEPDRTTMRLLWQAQDACKRAQDGDAAYAFVQASKAASWLAEAQDRLQPVSLQAIYNAANGGF